MKIILSGDDFGRSHEMNLAIDYAMRNGLICSTALLMGSEYTNEAVELAFSGEYVHNVHCHLNLAACISVGNHFVPLNEEYKKSRFCKNGEFANVRYYKPDFAKYSDVIFKELETQFLTFVKLTNQQGNYSHVDFHLYLNFSPPVAVAYQKLIRKYHIKTARFFGEHHRVCERATSRKRRLIDSGLIFLMKRNKACVVKSSKIEYYLERQREFERNNMIELYVHPDYRDGILIDKTNSVFGHDMKPLEEHIDLVKKSGNVEFISWSDLIVNEK